MIFVMLLMVILFLAAKSANAAQQSKAISKKKECPPHAWIYGDDGFLFCSVCNSKPGYAGRE